MFSHYDVIVIGAGHAGCEAAHAAATLGSRVLLVTMNLQTIAQMSCNPAMGGIAKGQIVREIDALGGMSGLVTDLSSIQFRMLNRSKGPGMWSPRAQCDRAMFAVEWRRRLEDNPLIDFWQDSIGELLVSRGTIIGVRTSVGHVIKAKTVVLTAGTFMNGTIHVGEHKSAGGRMAEHRSTGITEQLKSLGFTTGRLKTGTPPRVDGRSLNYIKMDTQEGDAHPSQFSHVGQSPLRTRKQRICWITHTNERTHEILKTGLDRSPMYTGAIVGSGPRYCPSVEDKVSRFADKSSHQLFVEPEGWNTVEIYVNGFSTSLPAEIQFAALREVPGFEHCKFFRPGYAIEYDYFPPTQLSVTLETKGVENLFFAGQINGTTGYEEAACQGLMAGINAHQKAFNRAPFMLGRNEAYIGVLIDDLVNKGTDEPYRMFTSRAEYRTLLRQDNADLRLTAKAHELGLASIERLQATEEKRSQTNAALRTLKYYKAAPVEINPFLEGLQSAPVAERTAAAKLVLRPELSVEKLREALPELDEALRHFSDEAILQAEIQSKYATYLKKEEDTVQKMAAFESLPIPAGFDYAPLNAISIEARQKLTAIQPATLGQASRISGVNPSDIQVLMVYMGR